MGSAFRKSDSHRTIENVTAPKRGIPPTVRFSTSVFLTQRRKDAKAQRFFLYHRKSGSIGAMGIRNSKSEKGRENAEAQRRRGFLGHRKYRYAGCDEN